MTYINGVFIDDIVAKQLPSIKNDVLKKDKDKVMLVDGREGSGKSLLASQFAKALDADFGLHKVAWNAQQFIRLIKSPERKKGDAIVMDEAFTSTSSRGALSNVNKAMMSVATEMRQKNLFVIIVLPSFFDLDRYFALWRCDTLFHVYFDKKGERGRYIIFPFHKKVKLFVNGKKTYNYDCVKSPYPPCRFIKQWIYEEAEYRKQKARAFSKRSLTIFEKRWRDRAAILVRAIHDVYKESDRIIGDRLAMKQQNIEELRNGDYLKDEEGF